MGNHRITTGRNEYCEALKTPTPSNNHKPKNEQSNPAISLLDMITGDIKSNIASIIKSSIYETISTKISFNFHADWIYAVQWLIKNSRCHIGLPNVIDCAAARLSDKYTAYAETICSILSSTGNPVYFITSKNTLVIYRSIFDKHEDGSIACCELIFIGPNSQKDIRDINQYMVKMNTISKRKSDTYIKPASKMFSLQKGKIWDAIRTAIYKIDTCNKYHLSSISSIMLYGEPGTGKSEIIASYVNKLELSNYGDHTYYINSIHPSYFLNKGYSLTIDDISGQLLAGYNNPKVINLLIFDDCDLYIGNRLGEASMDKDIEKAKYNAIQVFLEFLAKGCVGYNIICLFTTNHIDHIDSAVTRYGRMDAKIEVTNIPKELAVKMIKSFDIDDYESILKDETFPINPSYLQSKILSHKYTKIDKSKK